MLLALSGATCRIGRVPPPPPPRIDPDLQQRGALLFLDPRLSADARRSCASCHPGGGSDGRVYLNGAEVPAGTAGARASQSLRGAWQTGPYLWDGSAPTLREALERMLRLEMGGRQPPEADVASLETYLLSIPPYDSGRVHSDGAPREPSTLRIRRGFEIFRRAKCANCHPPPVYTSRRREDVGTGGEFDTPSLRGLETSAPYGHDGRWATLDRAVRAMLAADGTKLDELEIEYLLEYLKLL